MKSCSTSLRLAYVGVLAAFIGGLAWLLAAVWLYRPVCYPAQVRLIYQLDDAAARQGGQVADALRRCLWHEPIDCRVRTLEDRRIEVRFGTDPKRRAALRDKLTGTQVKLEGLLREVVDVVKDADREGTATQPAQSEVDRATTLSDQSGAVSAEVSGLLLASHLRRVEDVRAIIERGGGLAFRILAERSAVGEEGPALLSGLAIDGPRAPGAYTWCELADLELANQPDLIVGHYHGRPYILACATAELAMVQDRTQSPWRVQNASPGLDPDSRWTIDFTLDPSGGRQLEALTTRAINRQLAIVIGGRVYTAATVRGVLGARGQITGRFSYGDCVRIAGYLLAPPEPLGLQAGPVQEPQVDKSLWIWPEIPPHAGGGPVLMAGAVVGWWGTRRWSGHRGAESPGIDLCREGLGRQTDSGGKQDTTIN